MSAKTGLQVSKTQPIEAGSDADLKIKLDALEAHLNLRSLPTERIDERSMMQQKNKPLRFIRCAG